MTDKNDRQVRHFTDLEVWRRSHLLFLDLLNDLDPLPQKRSVAILTDQILRSVASIGANIAEGFNRSKKKYLNCLDIALERIQFCCSGFEACIAASNAPADATEKLDLV